MNHRIFLLLLLCVGMVSCRRAAEKAREGIRIEAVEAAEVHGMTGLDLVLRVRNDTGYKLRIDKVGFDVYFASSRVIGVRLRNPVVIPRHTVDSHATQWRVQVSDPLALYALLRRVRQNEPADLSVSFVVEGRGGPKRVNISRERMPLSEFLNTFGIDLQDLKNRFEP